MGQKRCHNRNKLGLKWEINGQAELDRIEQNLDIYGTKLGQKWDRVETKMGKKSGQNDTEIGEI